MINDYYTTLVLKKATETPDGRGGVITTYTDTEFQGLLTIASSQEVELARKISIDASHTLYCPTDIDVTYSDMIEFNDETYQIVAEPRNTVQRNHHFKVLCKKVLNNG